MSAPSYLKFLTYTGEFVQTDEGIHIPVWKLDIPGDDEKCLQDWSLRIRQSYCLDEHLDALREGTGLTRSQYIVSFAFPDEKIAPGPSIRAGDFAELLISDYVEFILGYWVPRGKYAEKESRNESAKGVDILGFKVKDISTAHPTDELLTYEVKAQFSDSKYSGRLQHAIEDSNKDYLRSAISLNATKRRFIKTIDSDKIQLISRFQNLADNPYVYKSGAAAMLSEKAFDEEALKKSLIANHGNANNLQLMLVTGKDLMKLAHAIYKRAADEA